jgi:hypothetical protein
MYHLVEVGKDGKAKGKPLKSADSLDDFKAMGVNLEI